MSNWEMGSKPFHDGTRDVKLDFLTDDAKGTIGGQLWFKNMLYTVNGSWAALRSVPGRNVSSFALLGGDSAGETDHVAAAGTMDGPGSLPVAIQLNLIRVESGNGQRFGWDGELQQFNQPWSG